MLRAEHYRRMSPAYVQIPLTLAMPINVTPVGNRGVLELNQTMVGTLASRKTLMFSGATGALTHVVNLDDNRQFRNEAKLRFYNAAYQFQAVDLVIGSPGGDPRLLIPQSSIGPGTASTVYIPLGPGDYLMQPL